MKGKYFHFEDKPKPPLENREENDSLAAGALIGLDRIRGDGGEAFREIGATSGPNPLMVQKTRSGKSKVENRKTLNKQEEEIEINNFIIFTTEELKPLSEHGLNEVKERMQRLTEAGIKRSELIEAIREIALLSFYHYALEAFRNKEEDKIRKMMTVLIELGIDRAELLEDIGVVIGIRNRLKGTEEKPKE